ncbi:pancreatic secretory granule membrane major glycoprotein GP2-like [Ruditapes philippinarum]|uniref:pancreatic secretory granule membrane major glycoprotein GP2-like n=1 Tax=Ruditapes philippinarum TaxID=129788 RepID=UPI00295AD57D|nr:pancreatic secretory granule membrane major glycoprotein GP2-like [Ruditapes philippinarum]
MMRWTAMANNCILFILAISGCLGDPCHVSNHSKFPDDRLGSRNLNCTPSDNIPLCDYFLIEDWYVIDNAVLSNKCPKDIGTCGVTYPVFLDGEFPDVSDGIVGRSACMVEGSNCCGETIQIQIKNCSGFYVYHLKPLDKCSSAYCFESTLPCIETTTTSTTLADKDNGDNGTDDSAVLIGTTVGVGVILCLTTIVVAVVILKTGWGKTQTSSSQVIPSNVKNVNSEKVHGKLASEKNIV